MEIYTSKEEYEQARERALHFLWGYKNEEELLEARDKAVKILESCGVNEEEAKRFLSYERQRGLLTDFVYGIIHDADWVREILEEYDLEYAGYLFGLKFTP